MSAAPNLPVLLRLQLGNESTEMNGTLFVLLNPRSCAYEVVWEQGNLQDGVTMRAFGTAEAALLFALEEARAVAMELAEEFVS